MYGIGLVSSILLLFFITLSFLSFRRFKITKNNIQDCFEHLVRCFCAEPNILLFNMFTRHKNTNSLLVVLTERKLDVKAMSKAVHTEYSPRDLLKSMAFHMVM